MITYKTGDIFKEKTEAIVNPVNCVGVAGAGLAFAFRKRYPNVYREYKEVCDKGLMKIGQVLVVTIHGKPSPPKYIVHVPTKRHWKDNSILEDVETGIKGISVILEKYNINSISIPALGCGLGGLEWNDVRDIMEDKLREHQEYKRIVIFEPR